MKITEIISEGRKGKLNPEHASVLHGARTFTDGHGIDGSHNFNRVGLALALADGSNNKLDLDDRTWFHANSIAVPYSELEHRMLDQAFKAVKTSHKNIVKNHKSQEHDSVHRVSPVPARRKNQYGI